MTAVKSNLRDVETDGERQVQELCTKSHSTKDELTQQIRSLNTILVTRNEGIEHLRSDLKVSESNTGCAEVDSERQIEELHTKSRATRDELTQPIRSLNTIAKANH